MQPENTPLVPSASSGAVERASSGPAVLEIDADGVIVAWSPGAQRLFGYAAGEIVGRPLETLLCPPARSEGAVLRRVLDGGSVSRVETVRRASDGRTIPVTVTGVPSFDAEGRVRGAIGIYEDLADAATGASSDALLRLVLDTTPDAYVAMDESGHIRDWNPAAEVLFGWSRAEAVGRPLAETIIPQRLRAAHGEGLRGYLAGGSSAILGRRVELSALRRDGREFPVEVTISPMRVGTAWLFAAFLRDITERTLAREALERDHGRLADAQQAGRLGSWEWQLDSDRVTFSNELYDVFGLEGGGALTRRTAAELVHPDDRERVADAMRAALAGEAEFDLDFRIVRPDGDSRTVHGRATVMRDLRGRPVRVVGTDIDVTERARAEAASRRLAAIVASTSDAVLTEDARGRIMSWNQGAEVLVGFAAADVLGRPSGTLLAPDRAGEDALLRARALAGDRIDDHQTQWLARGGAILDVSLTVSPVRDAAGRVVEISTIARDIGARKRAERELRRYAEDLDALARRDALTGLFTQRELHGLLDAELSRADRFDGRCSLVVIDVDGLAIVNDRWGRDEGDRLMRELAEIVRGCCSEEMAACRLNGDELAIVAPDASAGHAMALASRVKAAWRASDARAGISTGVATYPDEAGDKDALIASARTSLAWSRGAGTVGRHPTVVEALRDSRHADTADRLVALMRRHLGMEIAYLSEFVGDQQVVRIVDAGADHPDIRRGGEVPLEGGYCRRMIEAEIPKVIPDTAAEPTTAALEVTSTAGIGSYVGVPVRHCDGRLYGSLCCASREANHRLDESATHFAHVCARLIGDLLDQRELEEENRRLHGELTGVRALLAALDARDNYTGEHSEAVVSLAAAVARRLRLGAAQIAEVEQVALLHDIGKIGIPDSILHKPGPLSDAEWSTMREHPAIGARIIASIASLAHLAPAVRAEHERWDGRGYPDGLSGQDIPLASRIILACDAYHAMTSDRPYRAAMPPEAAVAELRAAAGSQFDSAVVDALLAERDDPRNPGDAQPRTLRPRVLVVEDDAALRLALEHGLHAQGFDVDAVADADAAYRRAVERRPHVVLLDWVLAGSENGPVVCSKLRERHPGTPVVMHTGLTDVRDRRTALEAGAHAFVEKGASIEALAATLRDAIGVEAAPQSQPR